MSPPTTGARWLIVLFFLGSSGSGRFGRSLPARIFVCFFLIVCCMLCVLAYFTGRPASSCVLVVVDPGFVAAVYSSLAGSLGHSLRTFMVPTLRLRLELIVLDVRSCCTKIGGAFGGTAIGACCHTSHHQILGSCDDGLFLRRKLSTLQWIAIVLLAVGTTTSQVKGCGEASCDSLFSAPVQGYMLGVLSACLSALAGVYTEFLMKKNNDSLYWQNVQLYTFGAIFNMVRLLMDDFSIGFGKGPWWQRLFDGYNITTWLVVINLGSTGLLVSWLMKFADNIVKVYSTSMAMLLTMILSIFLFDFKPTVQLLLGIIICMMSLHMYFTSPSKLLDLPMQSKATSENLIDVNAERTNS